MPEQMSIPYSWLKSVDPELLLLSQREPVGGLPPFPLKEFSAQFSSGLNLEPFSLSMKKIQWRSEEELAFDLGESPFSQEVRFENCQGSLWILLARSSLEKLILLLAGNDEASGTELFDEEVLKGFERFLLLRALRSLSQSSYLKALTPHLGKVNTLPEEPCLAVDLEMRAKETSLSLRLLLSEQMVRFLKEQTAERTLTTSISKETLQKLKAPLHVELGKVQLTRKMLKKLRVGDVLLLDLCSYDPETKKGFATLTLNGSPKAKASFENQKLVISEEPSYEESTVQLKRRSAP